MGSGDALAVHVEVLGAFRVVVDGRSVPDAAWPSRRSAELVQLLALTDRHRLQREQVLEALWPHLGPEAAAANLRKAAHHARQAIGDPAGVVLRGGAVALCPDASVSTDLARFEASAEAALRDGDALGCSAAADACGGELLPGARYEDWAEPARRRARALQLELLRRAGRWEDLVELEPTDEPAHQALMEAALAGGRRAEALRWYSRLRRSLASELGVAPDARSQALRERCVAELAVEPERYVGRAELLAELEVELRAAMARRGGAVVIRGVAGVGKTATLRRIEDLAASAGWAACWATAGEADVPYGPFVALAAEVLGDHPEVLARLRGNAGDVLSALVPGLPQDGPGLAGPLSRHQVVGAVQQLLAAAAGGPVVVLVDDAHLADASTVDVVGHLATSVRDVVVVVAKRDAPTNGPLARVLARLRRAGRLADVELGRMDDGDAEALLEAVGPDLDRAARDRIRHEAAGNPFVLVELARAAAGGPQGAATAADAMAARLVDLEDGDVDALRRLALGGTDLDWATASALTGSTDRELHDLLDRALGTGVLVVAGDRYRFCHDMVRQSLAGQLPPHRRSATHREAAERLQRAGGAPALVARHWLAGERPAEAVGPLRAAAAAAMAVGAFVDARAHLEPVLAHDPGDADALRMEAEALDLMGDPRALTAYDAAIAAAGPVDAQDLIAMRALAQIKQGDPAGGLAAIAGASPTSVAGRLSEALTYAGAAALGFADPSMGTAKAAESRRLALQTGDAAAVVIASWAQAAAAHARGELHDSVLADLRDTASVPHLAVRVFDGHLCMTQRFLYGARPYEEVIAFADALADEAARLGAARGHAFAANLRGEAELLSGRLDEAEADLLEGARLHRAIGGAVGEAHALQRLAEIAHHRGRAVDAARLAQEALDLARVTDIGFHLLDRIYGTRILLAAADPDAALAAVEDAEEAVRGQLETCPGCRITFAVPAAIACARAGAIDRAHGYEEVTEWLAHVVMRLPAWDAAHEEVRGHVRLATGDRGVARERFAAAAEGFSRAGQPVDRDRCRALASAC